MNITKSLALSLLFLTIGNATAHDLTRLPLGDGKISTAPRTGWIWACHTEPNAGGAFRDGPWIKSDGTYDLTAKAVVPGSVTWPSRFNIQVQQGRRVFTSNDLPSHPTGTFPIPADSKAYLYDRNPNRISQQSVLFDLPANPQLAAQPSCAPGAVGILLSGVALFNALDAPGRDAVAHETQDSCQGHPQVSGMYHYHNVSSCVDDKKPAKAHSPQVGYMVDGFGIYGRYGEGGKELASKDLDECHGHTHKIEWDGKQVNMYHYHATMDFPYTAGCMRGTYKMSDVMKLSGGPQRNFGPGGGGEQQRQGPGQMARPGQQGQQGQMPMMDRRPGPQGQDMQGQPPFGADGQQGGQMPPPPRQEDMEGRMGPPPGGHPDLNIAARKLGIDVQRLRAALGPPPPDLNAAAARLGISVADLKNALGVP